jgi:beta-phosphoglucomutase-like phosphatase (HAD superfamily)
LTLKDFMGDVPFATPEDLSRGKPHPDVWLLLAERLGVDIRDCMVVGDSPLDMVSARAAGAYSIGLPTYGADLSSAKRVIGHWDELTIDELERM